MSYVEITILGTLPSCANLREHWATRAGRVKAHRAAVYYELLRVGPGLELRSTLRSGAVVTLTRVAMRKLDDDNLASAFKAMRDGVADWLALDDGSPLLTWQYRQEKGKPPCVRVRIEVREEAKSA